MWGRGWTQCVGSLRLVGEACTFDRRAAACLRGWQGEPPRMTYSLFPERTLASLFTAYLEGCFWLQPKQPLQEHQLSRHHNHTTITSCMHLSYMLYLGRDQQHLLKGPP